MFKPALSCLVVLLFTLSACSAKQTGSAVGDPGTRPQAQNSAGAGTYYDFNDIMIPRAMTLQPKQSFIFEGPQVKTGFLVFKGRVDAVSLSNFFVNNMAADGWHLSSSFRSKRTILVFTKPGRDCIVNIVDGRFTTTLEIWVAPEEAGGSSPGSGRTGRPLSQ